LGRLIGSQGLVVDREGGHWFGGLIQQWIIGVELEELVTDSDMVENMDHGHGQISVLENHILYIENTTW
jgi:hypothetical protein